MKVTCYIKSNLIPGIGNLDDKSDTAFYQNIGIFAKNSSTTISIIGIEGSDCGVSNLGVCSDLSNGTVNVVNPLELQRQMRYSQKILRNLFLE
jgi:hypothetical protein